MDRGPRLRDRPDPRSPAPPGLRSQALRAHRSLQPPGRGRLRHPRGRDGGRDQPHPFGAFEYTGQRLPTAEVRLLAPVLPSKVVAIGRTTPSTPASSATRSRLSRCCSSLSTSVSAPVTRSSAPTGWAGSTSRASWPWSWASWSAGCAGRRYPGRARLHLRQRRDRARPATRRRPVDAAKGFDTFCPLGPWIETDSTERPGPGHPCQRRGRQQARPPSWSTAWPSCWPSCPR